MTNKERENDLYEKKEKLNSSISLYHELPSYLKKDRNYYEDNFQDQKERKRSHIRRKAGTITCITIATIILLSANTFVLIHSSKHKPYKEINKAKYKDSTGFETELDDIYEDKIIIETPWEKTDNKKVMKKTFYLSNQNVEEEQIDELLNGNYKDIIKSTQAEPVNFVFSDSDKVSQDNNSKICITDSYVEKVPITNSIQKKKYSKDYRDFFLVIANLSAFIPSSIILLGSFLFSDSSNYDYFFSGYERSRYKVAKKELKLKQIPKIKKKGRRK